MKKHIFSFVPVFLMLLFLFAFVVAVSYEVAPDQKVDQPNVSVLNAPAPALLSAAPIAYEHARQVSVADFVSEGVTALASNLSVTCVGCAACNANRLTSGICDGSMSREARILAPPAIGGQDSSLIRRASPALTSSKRSTVLLTFHARA